jgi:hypothetical protein
MNSQECLTPQATIKKKPFQYPINKKKEKKKEANISKMKKTIHLLLMPPPLPFGKSNNLANNHKLFVSCNFVFAQSNL